MPSQLPLRYDSRWVSSEAWASVLIEIRRTVSLLGLKEVAYDIDVTPSHLAHALAERSNHHVQGEWLVYLIAKAPDMGLAAAVAGAGGCAVVRVPTLTPEQELARLRAALEKNPAVAKAIYDEAGLK